MGQIYCPASMEIQGGAYKKYADNVKAINGVAASKVVFQQKGLNNLSEGLDTYARVMIRTSYGDFNSITTPVTLRDVNDVNNFFKNQIKDEASSMNAVIITWNKAQATTINGYKAIKFGYKRKVGTNPAVTVETYLIQNTNRMYSITFENREDGYKWSSAFLKIKSSLKISIN
ncbi:hypothetical protein GCM10027516_19730 [Niabella aquatica]